jgi:hypothetical protein
MESNFEEYNDHLQEGSSLLALIKGRTFVDESQTASIVNSEIEAIGESSAGLASVFDSFSDPQIKAGARGNFQKYLKSYVAQYKKMPEDGVLMGIAGAIGNSMEVVQKIGEANSAKGTVSANIPELEMIVSMETAIRLNCFNANTTHVVHSKQKEAKFYKRTRKALTDRAGIKNGDDLSMRLVGAYNQGVMNLSSAYTVAGEDHAAGVPNGALTTIDFVGVGHKVKKNMEVWYGNVLIAKDVTGNGTLSGSATIGGAARTFTGTYNPDTGAIANLQANGGAYALPALTGDKGLRIKAESNWEMGGEAILPRTQFEYESFTIKPHWNAGSTVTSFMAALDALTAFGHNLTSTGITELAMMFVASANIKTIQEQNYVAQTPAAADLYLQPKTGYAYDPSTYERDAIINYFSEQSKAIETNSGYMGSGDFIYVDAKCTDFLDRLRVHGPEIWRPRETRLNNNMKSQPHYYGRLGGATGWDIYAVPAGSVIDPTVLSGGVPANVLDDYEYIMGSVGNGTPYQSPIITGVFRTPLPIGVAMTNEFAKEDILVSEEYFHVNPQAYKWFVRGKFNNSALP